MFKINDINVTPLFFAVMEGHTEIVELLLAQPNIDVNYKDILIQKIFMKFKFNIFIIFNFIIVFGILKKIYI